MQTIRSIWPTFGLHHGKADKRTRKNGVRVRKPNNGTKPAALNDKQKARRAQAWQQIIFGRKQHAERQAKRHGGFYANWLAA